MTRSAGVVANLSLLPDSAVLGAAKPNNHDMAVEECILTVL